jgi:NADH dehydrogenase FAD-containing subunit
MSRHRVVVIGSGFGGLTATRALKNAPVNVTMISRTQHHLFQPLLYQVATGILSEGEIAPATRRILRNQRNAEVLLGDVVEINLAERYVAAELLGTELKGACPPLREPFHCVEREPFRYFDKGSMATVSRFSAVAKVGSLELSGLTAWVAWLLLHLVYLVGFKSKISTIISWAATFLTMNRGQLSITGRQALAQIAEEQPNQSDSAADAA